MIDCYNKMSDQVVELLQDVYDTYEALVATQSME
jgi:hypothetical protein